MQKYSGGVLRRPILMGKVLGKLPKTLKGKGEYILILLFFEGKACERFFFLEKGRLLELHSGCWISFERFPESWSVQVKVKVAYNSTTPVHYRTGTRGLARHLFIYIV